MDANQGSNVMAAAIQAPVVTPAVKRNGQSSGYIFIQLPSPDFVDHRDGTLASGENPSKRGGPLCRACGAKRQCRSFYKMLRLGMGA
jgi:hypothetical protein